MQVEAIYREGRIQFATPIRLKNHPIRVLIDIPDDEVEQLADQEKKQASAEITPKPDLIDQIKDIQALVRSQLESPANHPISKEDIRLLRAQAWEDKRRG